MALEGGDAYETFPKLFAEGERKNPGPRAKQRDSLK
jgi:hypothetical protein